MPSATRKAANLSLDSELLTQARELDINLSQACDQYLRELVRRERAQRWRDEHSDFIAAYNATVADEGLPLDRWKSF